MKAVASRTVGGARLEVVIADITTLDVDAIVGGPSIAVTLNENLDYFGQTVNVAARVQALADAGEICISEALYSAPGVSGLLSGHEVAAFDAPLHGVEGNACVYRIGRQ